jgi:hypothetical protein
MTGWSALQRECDAWAEAGLAATWWWRDDDAVEATPALATLLELQPRAIALAVIPNGAMPGLAGVLARHPGIAVLQHGFSHCNQAQAGERKSEFPDSRDPDAMEFELVRGQRRLETLFGGGFLPVLTPPWNRIGEVAVTRLQSLGYTGLSRYLPRAAVRLHGVKLVNTHVDVIDWRGSRGFAGESPCLARFAGHLQARRLGTADRDEPTGLLTHHLVHDASTWRFLEKLRDFLTKQSAARLLDPAAVFASGARSG